MSWHGPHQLPKRQRRPEPGAWLSWVALASICLLGVLAFWAGTHLP